jgi:hypothetical protein
MFETSVATLITASVGTVVGLLGREAIAIWLGLREWDAASGGRNFELGICDRIEPQIPSGCSSLELSAYK